MCEKIFFHKVSDALIIRRYWLIHDGTGSVWGSTGWFLVILGQYGAVHDGTGSVEALLIGIWWNCVLGITSWYLAVLGQFNLALLDIKCYWVSKGLWCHHSGTTTNEQGKIGLLSQ